MNSMDNDHQYVITENERAQMLDNIHVGTWRIERSANHSPRLYGDANMYAMLGAQPQMPPEQLYRHWHTRIEPAYLLYVDQAVERLIHTGTPVEVEYVWNHPRDGKTVVRCNGTLSCAQEGGKTVLTGLHWDITHKVVDRILQEDELQIVDHYKLSLCGKYLIRAYEDVFLVDQQTKQLHLIAYRCSHCEAVEDGRVVLNIVDQCVPVPDREKLHALFSDASLREIIAQKRSACIDFRRGQRCGRHQWVRGTIYPIQVNGMDELLFVVQDISNEYQMKRLQEEKTDVLYSVIHERSVIYEYDAEVRRLQIVKQDAENITGRTDDELLSVAQLVERLCAQYANRSDWPKVKAFLSDETLGRCVAEKGKKILALPLDHEKFVYVWVKISLLPSVLSDQKAYIVMELMDRKEQLYPILQSYIQNTADFFYYLDLKNDYFLRFIGAEEEYGMPPKEGRNYTQEMLDYVERFVVQEDRALVRKQMSPAFILSELKNKPEFSFCTGFIGADGEIRRKLLTYRSVDPSKGHVLLQRTDITEMYRKEQSLKKAQREAVTDALTQLYNRLGSERMIQKALAETDESKNAALIMMDVNQFKMVNDRFGHPEGDRVLRETARNLKDIFRSEDIIGRIGGDEFVVFLPNMLHKTDIYPVLRRLVEKFSLMCGNETEHFPVTLSVGATVCQGQSYEQLYREADTALYHSKMGENSFSLFDDISFQ